MIVIIDYGIGNLASVQNMLKKINVKDVIISGDIDVVSKAEKLILPGVGSFDAGMNNLLNSGLIDTLNKKVLEEKVPILGICLGMQLMTLRSEEGSKKGLGWINAETLKFSFPSDSIFKIPHMGWNYISITKANPLIDLNSKNKFYFVHSYYVKCAHEDEIIGTTNYNIEFTSFFNLNNIYGVQFHPEKSLKFGMKLLENFSKL
ncbi:MAG: imidazole glycerol phosphate synthase subunit HisH [Bacteroidota bacterium]|nr:imidazole glycerol phosphate synthase subunit HisH [Bacteroidota bacterium]